MSLSFFRGQCRYNFTDMYQAPTIRWDQKTMQSRYTDWWVPVCNNIGIKLRIQSGACLCAWWLGTKQNIKCLVWGEREMMLCCCQILRFKATPVQVLLPIFHICHGTACTLRAHCAWTNTRCTLLSTFERTWLFFNHVSKQVHFLCTREDNHMIDLYNSYQVSYSHVHVSSLLSLLLNVYPYSAGPLLYFHFAC